MHENAAQNNNNSVSIKVTAANNSGSNMAANNNNSNTMTTNNSETSDDPKSATMNSSDPLARSLPGNSMDQQRTTTGDEACELEMTPMFTNSFQGLGEPGKGNDLLPSLSLNENGSSLLLQGGDAGFSSLPGVGQTPLVTKDTTSSERRHNLELLEASFNNILTKQD
jgi:hypothetical protein